MSELKAETLRQLLRYDPETGKLFWLQRSADLFATRRAFSVWSRRFAGKEALINTSGGYRRGNVLGRVYLAHRIAWAIQTGEWPATGIDHINTIKTDNRWVNLRQADKSQNGCNQKISTRNTSGVKGVYLHKTGKWAAEVWLRGKKKYVGVFSDISDAEVAVMAARNESHGQFARQR